VSDLTPGQEPEIKPQVGKTEPELSPKPQADKQEMFDADYVRKLREENAAHRLKLRETEDKLKAYDAERLSDAEKLQKRAEKAEADAKAHAADLLNARIRIEIERQARKLSIVDEEAAYRLLDTDTITFEDGKPTNIEKLLTTLVQSKPWLVGDAGGASASNPNRGRGAGGPSIESIKGMTAAQIAALPEDQFQNVLKAASGKS